MKEEDRRTTLRIEGGLRYELRIDDYLDWQVMETCHCLGRKAIFHRFEVQKIGYRFRKLAFGGTFEEVCDFLEEHAQPFTPPVITNHRRNNE